MTVSEWKTARLGDLIRVRYGKALASDLRLESGANPVVGSAGTMARTDEVLVDGPAVVVGRKGNVGAVHLLESGSWPTDTTYYLAPGEHFDARFLTHQLRALELGQYNSSTAVPSLRRHDLEARPLVVPPITEQRRIVEILEGHLSRVDAALDGIDAAQRRLTRLRAAAGHQLQTYGWIYEPLQAIAHLVTDGDHNPPKRVQAGVPHITAKGIRNGTISLEACTYVSEEGFKQTAARYAPAVGDVIVTCVGTIGEVAVVPPDLRFSADRNLAGIRADTSRVLPDFLALALSGQGLQQRMRSASSSTAQPHLYLRDLRELPIPVPDIATQARIISETADLTERASVLAGSVVSARRRAQVLRRSLMEAALCGRLVTGPALIIESEVLTGV